MKSFIAIQLLLLAAAAAPWAFASTLPAPTPAAILLQWEENSPQDPAAGYNVFRSPGASAWAQINAEEIDVTEFEDAAAPLGCSCSYYVTALDVDGNQSAPSNIVTVIIPADLDPGTLAGSTA